jgi:hypothetical protein
LKKVSNFNIQNEMLFFTKNGCYHKIYAFQNVGNKFKFLKNNKKIRREKINYKPVCSGHSKTMSKCQKTTFSYQFPICIASKNRYYTNLSNFWNLVINSARYIKYDIVSFCTFQNSSWKESKLAKKCVVVFWYNTIVLYLILDTIHNQNVLMYQKRYNKKSICRYCIMLYMFNRWYNGYVISTQLQCAVGSMVWGLVLQLTPVS